MSKSLPDLATTHGHYIYISLYIYITIYIYCYNWVELVKCEYMYICIYECIYMLPSSHLTPGCHAKYAINGNVDFQAFGTDNTFNVTNECERRNERLAKATREITKPYEPQLEKSCLHQSQLVLRRKSVEICRESTVNSKEFCKE